MENEGKGLTVTVSVAESVQPVLVLVTVTLYACFVEGLTVIAFVVAPFDQRYVPPPVAVSVVFAPAQMERFPMILAVGSDLTEMDLLVEPVHPVFVLVTVT